MTNIINTFCPISPVCPISQKRQRKAVAFSRYSFYLNLYEFNSLIYTHSIFNFIKQPLVYTTFFISACLYFKMDSHHRFSKIQMVDGVSLILFLGTPSTIENKKKVFYKPIALQLRKYSFSFILGPLPKRSTFLGPWDCTSLSYYSSQVPSACTLLSCSPFSSERKLFCICFSFLG